MRIRITKPGIYGGSGEVPVGAEFNVRGDVPSAWSGRYEIVTDDPKPEAVAVVADVPEPKSGNPAVTRRKAKKGEMK